MAHRVAKMTGWQRRKARVRKAVKGTPLRPRLNVYRSNRHIYAQVIDDTTSTTLAAASTKDTSISALKAKNIEAAKKVGERVARLALSKGIGKVVFDRSGYMYHGRVKSLAEGARAAGLSF